MSPPVITLPDATDMPALRVWLRGRREAPWLDGTGVRFEPRLAVAGAKQILVGLGSPSGALDAAADGPGLALTQKGTDCRSVAAFVASRAEGVVATWRARFWPVPGRPFGDAELVVEDVSPDACLALVLLAARLAGVPGDGLPADWIACASDWESGSVSTAGAFLHSWGALLSAHTHALLADSRTNAALEAGIAYTADLIAEGANPRRVEKSLPLPSHRRALLAALTEEREYARALAQAETLQLAVPLARHPGEAPGEERDRPRRLVDALIETEIRPTGARKLLLRNDLTSPLGTGYVLWAVHRPSEEGTGNDITISVDPAWTLSLEPLWRALEAAEEAAWAGARPKDAPRPLVGYPDGGGPNDPWWDDHGRHTLLGAPKSGRKVPWPQVVEAVWRCFHPAGALEARPIIEGTVATTPVPLLSLPREAVAGGAKTLCAAVQEPTAQPPHWCPTLMREIAAWLKPNAGTDPAAVPPLRGLPAADTVRCLSLSGGSALLHEHGAFLLATSREELDWLVAMRETVLAVGDRFVKVQALEKELLPVSETLSDGVRVPNRKLNATLSTLAALQFAIQRALNDAACNSGVDGERRRLAEALEEAWGLRDRLETLARRANEEEALLLSFSRLHSESLVQALAVYGFPFALFSQFFAYIFDPAGDPGVKGVGYNGWGLLAYLGASIALALILRLILRAMRRGYVKAGTDGKKMPRC